MNGWIKLHRKIVESPVFQEPALLRLWVYCLLKATHKETEVLVGNQLVKLEPGQFITGRIALAEDFNKGLKPKVKVSESTLWRWLNLLETMGNLNIKSNNKFSVVTIEKWAFYQLINDEDEQQNEHQMNIKRTSNEHQMNTNKNIKNYKNDKEDNNTPTPFQIVAEAYMMNGFGTVSSLTADQLNDLIDTYSTEWVMESFKVAAKRNVRNLGYVEGILKRWKANGGIERGEPHGFSRPAIENSPPFDDDALFFGKH